MTVILTLLLCALLLLSISLRKTYRAVPLRELRRRSRNGDPSAKKIYKVASYGQSLDILLWKFTGIFSTVLFFVLVNSFEWWVALPIVLLIVWFAYAWLPTGRSRSFSQKIGLLLVPMIAKLLSWLQPLNSRLIVYLNRFHPITFHSGLYEKEDLIELLHQQANQSDNRITSDELRIVEGALTFGDKLVRKVMTPKRMIKTVSAIEPISPHVMDELHKSGFSRFPVTEGKGADAKFVGTLYLKDLIGHERGGHIRDVMKPDVYYVNEEQSLASVFDAAVKTHHHLFVVVNNFEEVVGVISLEDVLEQVIGKNIVDEFDQYGDLRAVAARQAKLDNHNHIKEQQPQGKDSPEDMSEELADSES